MSAEGAKRIARQSLRQKDKVISIPSVGEMFVFLDRLRVLRSLSLFFLLALQRTRSRKERIRMENFLTTLAEINDKINAFIWVKIGLVLLIGTGILMTCCTKWFQISHIGYWWQQTIGGMFRRDSGVHAKTDKKTISQFQALCTALAATIGTGNIAGVSAAIVIGGPGAVFWMWVAAFFGMMTNFSENVLGIYYRRRNSQGEWSGGAMYYLKDGLGGKKHCKTIGSVLAVLFSIFAILASFGIGNMGQINKIVLNMKSAFFGGVTATVGGMSVVSLACGIVLMILAALIVIGGLQRIATVAERVVPFMAVLYIIGSLIVFFTHISSVGAMFAAIFRFAFGSKAVAGGAAGIAIQQAITQGCKRGVFSNEAGLGSSVMVHSSSNVKEPVAQGMWGIFEVFFDTFVVCTMTAIVVLSSGYIDLETGLAVAGVDDATLVARAFGNVFAPLAKNLWLWPCCCSPLPRCSAGRSTAPRRWNICSAKRPRKSTR